MTTWREILVVLGVSALATLFAVPTYADTVSIKVGVNKNMDAQLIAPDGPGPYPAILVLHTSGGLQPADLDFAKQLVKAGYIALVPSFMEAYRISAKTRQETFTTYAEQIYADFVASLDQLRQNEKVNGKKLGVIGFSNGGYFALWLAATEKVQAGVSYYGALSGAGTDRSLSRYQKVFTSTSAPVLVLHGTNDSTVPIGAAIRLDSILTAAQTHHEFYQYTGAEHRFERDAGASNEPAATDAWTRTQAFLTKTLKE